MSLTWGMDKQTMVKGQNETALGNRKELLLQQHERQTHYA